MMILVSNKFVNVFSSEEMNDSHKKKQKRMWIQSFLKSVEVIMDSKMLICEIADSCSVFSPAIQQFLFPTSSFTPSPKKPDDITVLAALQV